MAVSADRAPPAGLSLFDIFEIVNWSETISGAFVLAG
jgi:hypothetical protein